MVNRARRPAVHDLEGLPIVRLREADVWDHSDLTLIRDTLVGLIDREGRRAVGIDMTHVKRLPSGYFGLLMDCRDKGAEVYLLSPQPNVRAMLWFRTFALPESDHDPHGVFRLAAEPLSDPPADRGGEAAPPRLCHAERLEELDRRYGGQPARC